MPLKRVLLITSNSSSRGGGEKYLVNLASSMQKLNIEVHVLISDVEYMNTWRDQFYSLGITVHSFPLRTLRQRKLRFISAIFDFRQVLLLRTICNNILPDSILVNQQYDEDGLDFVQGALFSRVTNVVGLIHMPMTKDKNKRPLGILRGLFLHLWYKLMNYKIIFVSKGSKQEFEDYYTLTSRNYVVNNGVRFSPSLLSRTFNNKTNPNIGFVGQLVPQKNLLSLAKNWVRLNESGYSSRITFVGDGPIREELESLLSNSGFNQWKVTGWIDNPYRYIADFDIFVMSSHYEGLPLSLVEAAGCGISSVVTPFNGSTDVADHASWVHIARTFSDDDFYYLLCRVIVNKDYEFTPSIDSLIKFKKYFSLERMAIEICEIMEVNL